MARSDVAEAVKEALCFGATVEQLAGQPLVRLPQGLSLSLPGRGMQFARVSMGGESYELPLEPDGMGGHILLWPGNAQAGPMTLEVLSLWPEPELPDDMREALEKSGLLPLFMSLTTKARWAWLRWVRATKVADTRQKHLRVMVDKLNKGMRRPCCFNEAGCTLPEIASSGRLEANQA